MTYLSVACVVDVDISPFLAEKDWKQEYNGSFGYRQKGSKGGLAAVLFGTSMVFPKGPPDMRNGDQDAFEKRII
jgi:hypothetical protein